MNDTTDAATDSEIFASKNVVPPTDSTSNAGVAKLSESHIKQESYSIDNGVAVIINNITFDARLNLPDRTGSDIDASSLFQRFQELGFESELLNDATDKDIRETFDGIKNDKKKLEKTDCLVVALLTHGNEDCIYATNTSMKIKNIMDEFNATNCQELILKPKIFIFQACRGNEIGKGVNARVIRNAKQEDPNQADSKAVFNEYDEKFGEMIRIPNEADFLAVYSSSPGYGAFRNTKFGSPFVRYLSEELQKMRKDEEFEFYKVLTRVNRDVGMCYKPNLPNSDNAVQMPCFVSHLTKNLVFRK